MNDDLEITTIETAKPRRMGWGAFSISLLIHGIFAVLAIFYFVQWIEPPKPAPPDFLPGGGGGGSGGTTPTKVETRIRSMVSPASSRKIAVEGAASFTLPDISADMVDSGIPMPMAEAGAGEGGGAGGGKGGGIGTGVGPGTGPGSGPGLGKGFVDSSPFGSREKIAGAMPGRMFDFKQDRRGKLVEDYVITRYEDFGSRVVQIHEDRFRVSAFRKFFEAPDTLYLTQVAIPLSDASRGPAFFGAEKTIQPSGWFIHYKGRITCNRDITFRFVGTGDDYLGVSVKGKTVLIAAWPGVRPHLIGDWEPAEPISAGAPTPLVNGPLTVGEWVRVKKGEKVEVDIGLGECPGGKVGFVLMIEEKDAKYRTMPNGAKILPLFSTEPIADNVRERITKDFPEWEFEWENVPVFPTAQDDRMATDLFR